MVFDFITNEERFAQQAQQIVNNIASPSVEALSGSIIKVSEENDYNADQIRRLSEAANHAMFAKLMANEETKFDKTSAFPIVDPRNIIKEYYSEKPEVKLASDISEQISDYYRSPKTFSEPSIKVAEYKEIEKISIAENLSTYEKEDLTRRLKDKLTGEVSSSKLRIMDNLDKLACIFSYSDGPDFNKFASKIERLYGNRSLPFLNLLSEQCGIEKIEFVKVSSVVNTCTDEFKLFKDILDQSENHTKFSQQIRKLDNALSRLKSL